MILASFLGLLGVMLVLGGAVLGAFAWRNVRLASSLTKPLSRIGKLQPGRRKVRGKIAPFQFVLRSPLTNRECVYYLLRVYEEQTTWKASLPLNSGFAAIAGLMAGGILGFTIAINAFLKSSNGDQDRATRSWRHLFDETESVHFRIEDDTGFVEVDPCDATIQSKTKSRQITNMLDPGSSLSRLTEKLRDEYGVEFVDERGNFKTLHFVEEALLVADKATILGTVEELEDGQLCFRKHDDPLLVSQENLSKSSQHAQKLARGFALGAGIALLVGLVCSIAAIVLLVRKM